MQARCCRQRGSLPLSLGVIGRSVKEPVGILFSSHHTKLLGGVDVHVQIPSEQWGLDDDGDKSSPIASDVFLAGNDAVFETLVVSVDGKVLADDILAVDAPEEDGASLSDAETERHGSIGGLWFDDGGMMDLCFFSGMFST